MDIQKFKFSGITAFCLGALFLVTDANRADAQSTRNWNRSVSAGEEMEFQWLNYDDQTCKDRGFAKLVINKKPTLGTYRTVRRKFTQQDGKCKGAKLSVLLVYYVAGRNKGTDRTSYTIRGQGSIRINLKMRVK